MPTPWCRPSTRRRPAYQAIAAYLDGVNQYQASHPAPIEFDILGIPKRPFTPEDTLSVAGYLAYSFASAFRTEPVMTAIRDKLGARLPHGVRPGLASRKAWSGPMPAASLSAADWAGLNRIAQVSRDVLDASGMPLFEGSNAWAIAGSRTVSGKPILAGDPHIGFSAPAVWYEAHLQSPGMELYGHFQVLNPLALLGHNRRFGWSMTMFQNDDIDMVVEKPNPDNPNQVWDQGRWVDLQQRSETIAVKGAPAVTLQLRRSRHGPIITDAYPDNYGKTPVAMWWAFLETENPILDAFYELNRADTLDKARAAASKIHAPGLNVVWANASGDIGWWAAAKLPIRPEGVNPTFLLDGTKPEAEKPGFHPFADNPQEENPARGFVVSANHQPHPASGIAIPGYYQPADRVQRLVDLVQGGGRKSDVAQSMAMQRDVRNGYSKRVLTPLLPVLRGFVTDPVERRLLDQLAVWDGSYSTDKIEPTVFFQLLYEIAQAAMRDELGPVQFKNLLGTRMLDYALPLLAADAASPWWDDTSTGGVVESRTDTLQKAWRATMAHLHTTFGDDLVQWSWGRAHTLTHNHPLGQQKPLDKLFSVGPFGVPGGRELPNALGTSVGPGTLGRDLRPVDPPRDRLRGRHPGAGHQPARTKRRAVRRPLPRPGAGVCGWQLHAPVAGRRRCGRTHEKHVDTVTERHTRQTLTGTLAGRQPEAVHPAAPARAVPPRLPAPTDLASISPIPPVCIGMAWAPVRCLRRHTISCAPASAAACISRASRSPWCARGLENRASPRYTHRRQEQREDRSQRQAAKNHPADRGARLGARAAAQHQRQGTEHGRRHGHDDRAQAQAGRLLRGLVHAAAGVAQLVGELDHQDAVLGHHADQQQQPDLRVDVERGAAQRHREHRRGQSERHADQHHGRAGHAFELRHQHQEHHQQRNAEGQRHVAPGLLQRGRIAAKQQAHAVGQFARGQRTQPVDRLLQRHAARP